MWDEKGPMRREERGVEDYEIDGPGHLLVFSSFAGFILKPFGLAEYFVLRR